MPCLRPDVVADDTAKLVQLVLTEDEFLSTVVAAYKPLQKIDASYDTPDLT